MSQRIGKSERFSVESIAKALERDRPSEALLAIAYLRTRSITIDAYLDTGLPTLMYDFSSPEGEESYVLEPDSVSSRGCE